MRASFTWCTVRRVSSAAWFVRSKSTRSEAVVRCRPDRRSNWRWGTTCRCSCRIWCSCISCLSGSLSFGSWFGVGKRPLINRAACMISISGSWHSTTIRKHYPHTTTTTSTPFSSSSKYPSKAKYQFTASSPSAESLTRTYNLFYLSKSLNNGNTIISKKMNKLSWNTSSSMLASHHLAVGTFTSSL